MIDVRIKTGKECLLELTGHAGYAEAGSDIVCASCTILAYVVANAALDAYEADELRCEPEISMEAGNIRIRYMPFNFEVNPVMDAIRQTFELIADTYPQNVRIIT